MKVTGSYNEVYALEVGKKRIYNGYKDYQVSGGAYIARIFDRSFRKKDVEVALCRIVYEGTQYGDQKPLNVLYSHGHFVGFLYEGVIEEMRQPAAAGNMDYSYNNTDLRHAVGDNFMLDNDLRDIVIQVVIAIVMGIAAILVVHPVLENFMMNYVESGIAQTLYLLDYFGIPAFIAGLILQIVVSRKIKDCVNNVIICGLSAMAANLIGSVAWTVLVIALIMLVQGIVTFLLKYLAVIILCVFGYRWFKKKR